MENIIKRIDKSYKYDGHCMVATEDGRYKKRKLYSRTTGRLAGRFLINMDSKVYSFKWNETGDQADILSIRFEGSYKDIMKDDNKEQIQHPEVKHPEIPLVIEVPKEDDGKVRHEKFQQILTCAENDIPVYLHGPAGSGKNHTLQQVSEDLGLEFYFTNSVQQEYKITGFIDAGGKYHETEFYKAFTNGGLFFLDELDASIPEVLVLLNAAIANRYFEFPNGKVYAHKDFRVVAAGNTTGNGADEQYTGRLQIDQSTLDRFTYIEFGYSEKIEMAIAKGNRELVEFVRGLRKQAEERGIRATFSYRCIAVITKLEGKMDLQEILTIAVFKGMDRDTLQTFTPMHGNKYGSLIRNLH